MCSKKPYFYNHLVIAVVTECMFALSQYTGCCKSINLLAYLTMPNFAFTGFYRIV